MRIKILEGKLEGHTFEINSDNFLIGRSVESDIQIPDPSISRQHAKIFKNGDKYFIKDLKSCNGTWIDGRLLWPGNEVELRQGLRLAVGDTLITLDNFDSGKGSACSYSIDLSSVREPGSLDLIFKDRRMANRKNLELICGISEALLRPIELDAICEKIIDYIFYSLKRVTSCAILMVDQNNNNIHKLMDKVKDPENEGVMNYSRSIVWQVVNERNAIMIEDIDKENEIAPSESMEMMGIKSVMCVPLIAQNDIIGVIYAHSIHEPNVFRKDDLYMLVALSTYASIAIDNATEYALKRKSRYNIDIQFILRQKLTTLKSLAGVISHEFNNLLMCIQGETSLLLFDTPHDDPKYARMKKIEKHIANGAELSTLACGFPVPPQQLKDFYDLNRLTDESVNNFTDLPDNAFNMEHSSDPWPVKIDDRQVLNALINIFFYFLSVKNRGTINIKCENLLSDSYRKELTDLDQERLVAISIRDEKHYIE
ncbi:MAG: FHA domain-containing protein, partial [Deltaproteobacteria bacterium]|nr:FHA domain-containing protein [Deltaproteobacteria bacterium]